MSKWLETYYPHLKEMKEGLYCNVCNEFVHYKFWHLKNEKYISKSGLQYGCNYWLHTMNIQNAAVEKNITSLGYTWVNAGPKTRESSAIVTCDIGHKFKARKSSYFHEDRLKKCPICKK